MQLQTSGWGKNLAHQLSRTAVHDDRKYISDPGYAIDQCESDNVVLRKGGSRVIEKIEHR